MTRSTPPQIAPRTVTSAELDAHYITVESLVRRAVDHDERVEVDMESTVPGSAVTDRWQFRLTCVPWLADGRAQFLAAYSIRLLLEDSDDYHGESREEWDDSPEIVTIDAALPAVTCALATFLLRTGWLCINESRFVGAQFRACEAIDCEFSFAESRIHVSERIRPLDGPPIAPPHWMRAQERRGGPERDDCVPDGWVSPEAEAVAAARGEDHGDWWPVSKDDEPKS